MLEVETLHSFLKSDSALDALARLRKGESRSSISTNGLSPDDRTYLEAEACVRDTLYSQLESRIQPETSKWVRSLSFCYRDLFTHPQRALDALDELEAECPSHFEFPIRLRFWRAHLNLILGKIDVGKRALVQIATDIPSNSLWTNEMLTIRALGYYYIGRTRDSLRAHRDCQASIDQRPDVFIQTFNSGMAARAALKLCDPTSFEYFTQKLEESLREKDDSRYRLRHTGYRAMIFNQLGEHDLAEIHWKTGDDQLHTTESAIERGQYLVFRGMSYALVNHREKARQTFGLALHELRLAGSPALYLTELDIAQGLAPISNPEHRSWDLKNSLEWTSQAKEKFQESVARHVYPMKDMYVEAAEFCAAIIAGSKIVQNSEGRQSLVLSVIENFSNAAAFAKGVSHFRLVPNFVHAVAQSDLSREGISASIERVLQVRPTLDDDRFTLPGKFRQLAAEPEVKSVLEFGSTLYSLGQKSVRLSVAEARLKESARAKHLLHDLRFFATELSRQAKGGSSNLNLSRLSGQLEDLIDSYLQAMKSGENPTRPVITHLPGLLSQVADMTTQVTGVRPETTQGGKLPFLWVSETLLKRLLLNLIKNGIEAGTGPRPVAVSYKTEQDLGGGERLVIYISDNGPGLNPSTIEAIRADQSPTSASTKHSGVGLGLRSAIECADEIGAELTIVSGARSSGTTFRILLPIPRPSSAPNMEIVVIDDSQAVLEAWKTFAKVERIPVACVFPEAAVSVLNHLPETTRWIVVDYDLKLQGCTGADLAPALAKLGPKVALSTGFQWDEAPEEVRGFPWNAVINKEPQYPSEHGVPKKIPELDGQKKRLQTESNESRDLRHDIKNELTPLRTAYRALSSRYSADPHLPLIAHSIRGIERIVRRKEAN